MMLTGDVPNSRYTVLNREFNERASTNVTFTEFTSALSMTWKN